MEDQQPGFVETDTPHNRWYEQSLFGRVLVWFQRLTPMWFGVLAIFLGLGFEFRLPSDWFRSLESQIEVQEARINAIEAHDESERRVADTERAEMLSRINFLIRVSCLQMTVRERATLTICDEVSGVP